MTDTTNGRVFLKTFEGSDIFVLASGAFETTPPGCRKARTAMRLHEIENEIKEATKNKDLGQRRKEIKCEIPLRAWKNGVAMDLTFKGLRSEEGDYWPDFKFSKGGSADPTTNRRGTVLVLNPRADVAQLAVLRGNYEEAKDAYFKARTTATTTIEAGTLVTYNWWKASDRVERAITHSKKIAKAIREAATA